MHTYVVIEIVYKNFTSVESLIEPNLHKEIKPESERAIISRQT